MATLNAQRSETIRAYQTYQTNNQAKAFLPNKVSRGTNGDELIPDSVTDELSAQYEHKKSLRENLKGNQSLQTGEVGSGASYGFNTVNPASSVKSLALI